MASYCDDVMTKAGKRTVRKKARKKPGPKPSGTARARRAAARKANPIPNGRIPWLDKHPKRRALLVLKVQEGAKPPSSAGAYVEVAPQRFHEWLNKGRADLADGIDTTYARFAEEIRVAEEVAFDEIHRIVREGIKGVKETTTVNETITEDIAENKEWGIPASTSTKTKVSVHERFKTDPKLGLAYMQAMRPAEWGSKQEVKHVGEINVKRIILRRDPAEVLPATPLGSPGEGEGEE